MFGAFFQRFDMAVQHRGVLGQANAGGGTGYVHPACAVQFAVEQGFVNTVGKDFNPAAGKGVQSRFHKFAQHVF